jgi:NTP-dependent ternary system trypsin peptidase co-occuring protein
MPSYIEFETEDGRSVLVEVEDEEVTPRGGVSKAGLLDKIKKNIAKAESKLDEAVQNAVKENVRPFVKTAQDLAKETQAVEMEVTFGLVMTGEIGNVAVGKAGAQSNYTVTLRWTQFVESKEQDGSGSQN